MGSEKEPENMTDSTTTLGHLDNTIIEHWVDDRKWRAVRAGKGGVRIECHTSDEDFDQAAWALDINGTSAKWEFIGGHLDDAEIPRQVWLAIWKDTLGFVPRGLI